MSAGKERLRPPAGSAALDNGQVVTAKDTVIATALDGLGDAQAAVARSLEAVAVEAARRAEFSRWMESRNLAGGPR